MDLFLDFELFINKHHLLHPGNKLLLACSGGLDSVVLAHLCKRAGFSTTLAHCNFRLRGAESDADAAFVRQLAADYAMGYEEALFDTEKYALENRLSIQVAARQLRYGWFQQLAKDGGFNRILTAHHADDSIETLLMNFFKGTGIRGLHGILPVQGNIVRPLLFAARAELAEYAHQQKLAWREDSSNTQLKYTRNQVRHELMPAIEKVFPQARKNLAANIQRFSEAETLYQQALGQLIKKMVEKNGNEFRLPVKKLLKNGAAETILWELAAPLGFTAGQVPDLARLLYGRSGAYVCSSSHQVLRHGAWLLFAPLHLPDNSVFVIEKEKSVQAFGNNLIEWSVAPLPSRISTDPALALLDAAEVEFPLLLRRWKAGDYFYPLGMPKKKKIARFLIDNKLSKIQKENTWVLESHKRIVWVVGQRIDDRFKIKPGTRKALQLKLSENKIDGSA